MSIIRPPPHLSGGQDLEGRQAVPGGHMKTRLLIMRPDQPHESREIDLPREPGYDALDKLLRPLLDDNHLERVAVLSDFAGGTDYQPADMFVDEMGSVKALPRNEAATLIYRRATMLGRTGVKKPKDHEDLPAIYGPAILFDRRVWF